MISVLSHIYSIRSFILYNFLKESTSYYQIITNFKGPENLGGGGGLLEKWTSVVNSHVFFHLRSKFKVSVSVDMAG